MKWLGRLRAHKPIVASTAIFFFVLFGALQIGWNVQTAIYLVTGLVVLYYTYETYRMRKELVRQNQLAVQPLILATVKRVNVSHDMTDSRVVLRNIGRGPALFVRVDDFNVHDEEGGGRFSLRIPPVDCIEGGMETALDVELITRETSGRETPQTWHFAGVLDPKSANSTYIVTICYEDIDRGQHWAKTQMGKGGIRLLDHGRGEGNGPKEMEPRPV
jgi:hypothetical protein